MIDSADSLFARIAAGSDDGLPPVHRWHPSSVQDPGMRVSRDGTWWYQGSAIRRQPMVRLFSRVLRREGDAYFLVTPLEKVRLHVELAPLLAVRMEVRGRAADREIAFETNVGDLVVADRAHPLRLLGTPDAPLPVVEIRDRIEALIVRSVYYELVAQGEPLDDGERVRLRSRGAVFELGGF